jgi:hypothetical protein
LIAGKIHHRRDRNDYLRELHEIFLGQDIGLERYVRVGEQYRLGLDLLDPGARSYGLIIDIYAGLLGVSGCPGRLAFRANARPTQSKQLRRAMRSEWLMTPLETAMFLAAVTLIAGWGLFATVIR